MKPTPSPSPLDALDAFYGEHRLCGDLDGGVDEGHDGQAYGWFDCLTCDARVAKRLWSPWRRQRRPAV
jgi:hypothetical protein